MVDRFLRYSLENRRRIALMIQNEKGIRRVNLTVERLDTENIYYTTARSEKEKALPRSCVLSAAYARGDDGDTLARENEGMKFVGVSNILDRVVTKDLDW